VFRVALFVAFGATDVRLAGVEAQGLVADAVGTHAAGPLESLAMVFE
jgi:hypothetical protein